MIRRTVAVALFAAALVLFPRWAGLVAALAGVAVLVHFAREMRAAGRVLDRARTEVWDEPADDAHPHAAAGLAVLRGRTPQTYSPWAGDGRPS